MRLSLHAYFSGALLLLGITRPALAGDVLQQVVSNGTVRIAVMGSLPPYTTMTPSGEPEGFDIEVAKRLAVALGVKPQFLIVDSAGRVAALQTHKAPKIRTT